MSSNSTSNYGAIIGGSVGGGLFVLLVIAIVLFVVCLSSFDYCGRCLCCASPYFDPDDRFSGPYFQSAAQPAQPPTGFADQPVLSSPNANSPSWINFSTIRNQLA